MMTPTRYNQGMQLRDSAQQNFVARLGTDDRWLTKERWHCCGPLKPNLPRRNQEFGWKALIGTCFPHCRSVLPEVSLHHRANGSGIVETCDLGCGDAEASSTRDLFISVVPNTSRNGSSGGSNVRLLPQATRKRPEWIPQNQQGTPFCAGNELDCLGGMDSFSTHVESRRLLNGRVHLSAHARHSAAEAACVQRDEIT